MMSVLSPLTISPVNRWYGRQQRGRGLSCNTCPILDLDSPGTIIVFSQIYGVDYR
jgi:hypothetical protein